MSTKESAVRSARIGEAGLYLFNIDWIEFKKLIDKIDKAYDEIG